MGSAVVGRDGICIDSGGERTRESDIQVSARGRGVGQNASCVRSERSATVEGDSRTLP